MWLPLVTKCQLLRWRWKLHVELFLLKSTCVSEGATMSLCFLSPLEGFMSACQNSEVSYHFIYFLLNLDLILFLTICFVSNPFLLDLFLILSLCIWFHLVFISNLIIIFFITIFFLFWILFIIDFFFNFFLQHWIS